jgi:TP901 family phage tail tape measure protein
MAERFDIIAQIQLQGPANLRSVRQQIQRGLQGINANVSIGINRGQNRTLRTTASRLNDVATALGRVQANAQSAQQALAGVNAQFNAVSQGIQQTSRSTNNASQSLQGASSSAKEATDAVTAFGTASGLAVKRFVAFSIGAGIIVGLTSALKEGTQEAIAFERELVRISQVTGQLTSTLGGLTDEITRLATGLGVSSSELIQVSRILSQAGLSASETTVALEALARSALAPTFDNINDTAEGAIAIFRQFGVSADELSNKLGSINAIAGSFAVESGDLITAIRRTGGAFQASGGSLEELLALFTSVRATTRESADAIATGFRTIFTRLQRPRTIEFLRQLGVELQDVEGNFIGPFEAVRELNAALSELDTRDPRFAKIIEELGGFRQVSRVIPLIQQFDQAQRALNTAFEGQDSVIRDSITAQESLAVQIQRVQEQFLALFRRIADSSTFQTIASGALNLAEAFINVADSLRPILPLLATVLGGRALIGGARFTGGFLGGLFGQGAGAAGQGVAQTVTGQAQQQRNQAQLQSTSQNTQALNNLTQQLVRTNQQMLQLTNAVIASNRTGGGTRGFATGGLVPGKGNGDTVPAMLTPGEFVIRKKAVETIGVDRLQRANATKRFASGGIVNQLDVGDVRKSDFERFQVGGPVIELPRNKKIGQIFFFKGDPKTGESGTTSAKGKNVKTIVAKAIGTEDKQLLNATLKNITFQGKLDSHKLDEKTARPAFEKDIERPVFSSINRIVRKFKPPGRVGQNTNFDIADNQKAVETISGFMFESFLESATKVPAQGDTAPFDFKGTGSLKQFSKLVEDQPVTAQFLDAKRSKVTPGSIVSKAANEGLFDAKLKTPAAKKKILQARDEARAELGVTAQSLQASARKAMGGFIKGNVSNSLRQKFQTGGEAEALTNAEQRRLRSLNSKGRLTKAEREELNNLKARKEKSGVSQPIDIQLGGKFGVAFLNIGASGREQDISSGISNIDRVAADSLKKSLGTRGRGKQIQNVSAKPQLFSIEPNAKENFTREVIDPIGANLQTAANKSLGANQIGNIPFRDLVSKSGFNATVGQLFEGFVRTATKSGKVDRTSADAIFDIPNVGSAENFKTLFGSEITSGTPLEIKGNEQLDASLIGNLLSKHIKANSPAVSIKKAAGGGISGQDTVPALLTPGEFVINKDAARAIGGNRLRQLNRADKVQGFNKGGFVGMQDGGEVETATERIAQAAVSSDNLGRKGLQTVLDNVQPGQKVSAILGVAGSGKSRFALNAAQLTSPEQALNASELLFEQANENIKPGSVLSKILALTKSTGGTVTLINPPAEQVREQRQRRAEVGATSSADTRSAGQLKGIAKAGDKIPLTFSNDFITFLRSNHQSNLIERKAMGGFIEKLASGGFVRMQTGGEVPEGQVQRAAVSSDNLGRKGLQTVLDNVQPGQKVSAILGVAGAGKSRFTLGAAQLTSPEQASNASELLFEQANENVKPGSVLSKILALTKSTGGTVTLINPPAEQVRQQRQLRAEVGATSPADTRSAGQLKGIAKAGDKIPLSFSKEFITFLRSNHQSNLIEQKASGGFIEKFASGGLVRMQTGGEVGDAGIIKAAVSSDNLGRKGLQTVLDNVQPNQKVSAVLGVAGSGKSRFALGAKQLTSPEQASEASELLFEQANENIKPGSVLSRILALTKSTGGTVTLINPPEEQVREQRQRRAEVGATSPADTRSAGQLKGIAKAGDKIPLSFTKEFITFLRQNHSNLIEQKAMGGFIEKLGQGGIVKRFAQGGLAKGTDTVPALLTPGEFVIKKDSAKKIGKDNLETLNQAGKFADGGLVNKNIQNGVLLGLFRENAVEALQTGGRVRPRTGTQTQATEVEQKPSIAKLRRILRGQSLSTGVQSLIQRINQLNETEASQLLSVIPSNARVLGSGREGIALDIGNGRVVRLGSVGTPQSFLGVTGTFEGRPDVEEFLQPLLTPTGQKAVKTVKNITAEVLPKAVPLDKSGATPEQQNQIINSIVTSLNRKGFLQTDLGPKVAGNIGLIREGGKVKAKIIDPNVAIQIKDREQAEALLGPQDPREFGRGGFIKRFASGGMARGTDTVPALLTPGEFVIRKDAAKAIGSNRLKKLNQADKFGMGGKVQRYARGGFVQRFQDGGNVQETQRPSIDFSALIFGLSALASTVSDTDSAFGQFSQIALGAVSTFTLLNGTINSVGPGLQSFISELLGGKNASQQNTATIQESTNAMQQNVAATQQETSASQAEAAATQSETAATQRKNTVLEQEFGISQRKQSVLESEFGVTQRNVSAKQSEISATQRKNTLLEQEFGISQRKQSVLESEFNITQQSNNATQQETAATRQETAASQQAAAADINEANASNTAASADQAQSSSGQALGNVTKSRTGIAQKLQKAQGGIIIAASVLSATFNSFAQENRKQAQEIAQNARTLEDIDRATALGATADAEAGAATGIQTGALVGGIVGAFGGPAGVAIGTAIGSVAGGLIGAAIGDAADDETSDEARAARQSVFNAAVEDFSGSVKRFQDGTASQAELGKQLDKFITTTDALASTGDTVQREQLQRQQQQQLPELQALVKSATQTSNSFDEFSRAFGGRGDELLGVIAQLSGRSLTALRQQVENNINTRLKLNEATRKAEQGTQRLVSGVTRLNNFVAAINDSTTALQQFNSTISQSVEADVAGSLAGGGVQRNLDIGETLDRLLRGQTVSADTIDRALSGALAGLDRPLQQSLSNQVQAIVDVQNKLPDLLRQSLAQTELRGGGGIDRVFEDIVRNQLGGENITSAQAEINDLIISRFRRLATGGGAGQSGGPANVARDIENSGEEFAKKLINTTDKDVIKSIKSFTEAINKGADEIAKIGTARSKVLLRLSDERVKLARSEANAQAIIARLRDEQGGQLQRANQAFQQQLQALGAGGLGGPEEIRRELERTQQQRETARVDRDRLVQQAGGDSEAITRANTEFSNLSVRAVNLRKALELLAKDTTRLSAAQKELSRLQSQRDTRRNFVTQAIFGDRDRRRQTVRQIGAVGRLAETGNIDDIRGDLRQDVLSFLTTFKDQQLAIFRDAQGEERTGEDIINQVVENFARTQARNADEAKALERIFKEQILGPTTAEEKLREAVAKSATDQVEAQQQIVAAIDNQKAALEARIPDAINKSSLRIEKDILTFQQERLEDEKTEAAQEREVAFDRERAGTDVARTFGVEGLDQARQFVSSASAAVSDIESSTSKISALEAAVGRGPIGATDVDIEKRIRQVGVQFAEGQTVGARTGQVLTTGDVSRRLQEAFADADITLDPESIKAIETRVQELRTGGRGKAGIVDVETGQSNVIKKDFGETFARAITGVLSTRRREEETVIRRRQEDIQRAAPEGVNVSGLLQEGAADFRQLESSVRSLADLPPGTNLTILAEAATQAQNKADELGDSITRLGEDIQAAQAKIDAPAPQPQQQQQGARKGFLGRLADLLGFNQGGLVPGVGNRDTVPAALTPGEFVLRKSAVNNIGLSNLKQLNETGVIPGFQLGGAVSTLNLLGVTPQSATEFIDNFKKKFNTGDTLEAFVGEDGARIVRGVANIAGVAIQGARQVFDDAQAEVQRRDNVDAQGEADAVRVPLDVQRAAQQALARGRVRPGPRLNTLLKLANGEFTTIEQEREALARGFQERQEQFRQARGLQGRRTRRRDDSGLDIVRGVERDFQQAREFDVPLPSPSIEELGGLDVRPQAERPREFNAPAIAPFQADREEVQSGADVRRARAQARREAINDITQADREAGRGVQADTLGVFGPIEDAERGVAIPIPPVPQPRTEQERQGFFEPPQPIAEQRAVNQAAASEIPQPERKQEESAFRLFLPEPDGREIPEPLAIKALDLIDKEKNRITAERIRENPNRRFTFKEKLAIQGQAFDKAYQDLGIITSIDDKGRPTYAKEFPKFNSGGGIPGFGNKDKVPALLTPGEFVINKRAAGKIGMNNLRALNNAQGFNRGGAVQKFQDGGLVADGTGGAIFSLDDGSLTELNSFNTNFQSHVNSFGQHVLGFGSQVTTLQTIFTSFISNSQTLADAMNNFTPDLTLTATHQVNVNISGADVLARIEPSLREMVDELVSEGIANFKEQLADGRNPFMTDTGSGLS